MLLQSLTIVFYVCLCSSLVGKLPDTLLFSCLDELFAELRVSDADHELCSLPCVPARQVDFALVRHYVVSHGTRGCYDVPRRKVRLDIAVKLSVFIFICAVHAQESLASR